MGRIGEIVFDCDHPAPLAAFWAQLLDGYAVRQPGPDELARLASLGLTPVAERSVMVDGPGPSICFQNVDGRRPDNNRVHFDIEVTDRLGEAERLKAAGAEPVRVLPTSTIMADPEGNQFCLVDAQQQAAAVAA